MLEAISFTFFSDYGFVSLAVTFELKEKKSKAFGLEHVTLKREKSLTEV